MYSHTLYVVTQTHDSITKVLGVYDADIDSKYQTVTLDSILDYYENKFNNTQRYYDSDCGYIDVLDSNDMLYYIVKVSKVNALIKNK